MTDENPKMLNDEEQEVITLLSAVVQHIYDWGLRANQGELIQAVHVIQGFIIQHMLQRLSPEWSKWYVVRDEAPDEEPAKTA